VVDPKTVPFTVGASAKKKRENASYKSSKGNVFQVDRYKVRTSLRELVDRKDVVLLKASWLSKQGFKERPSLPARQQLEEDEPDAFADPQMLERCLKEVVRAATELVGDDLCHYPGVVVISYRWITPAHPDPHGTVLTMLAPMLEWYAAQRAVLGFEPDFCVMLDWCSTHQEPRSDDQKQAFERAQKSMDIWYAHWGTMTWLLSSPPPDNSEGAREYSEGGWTTFEQAVCSAGKLPVYCLDMGKFSGGGAAQKFEEREWRVKYRELFAKEGTRDQNPTDAGLKPMIEGTIRPPLASEAFKAELEQKQLTAPQDRSLLSALYNQVTRAMLGSASKLSYSQLRWSASDFKNFGGALNQFAGNLETLGLSRAGLDDAGLEGWCAALQEGAMPKLTSLKLDWNPYTDLGCTALAAALQRKAMPLLVDITMDGSKATSQGVEAVRAARPGLEEGSPLNVSLSMRLAT